MKFNKQYVLVECIVKEIRVRLDNCGEKLSCEKGDVHFVEAGKVRNVLSAGFQAVHPLDYDVDKVKEAQKRFLKLEKQERQLAKEKIEAQVAHEEKCEAEKEMRAELNELKDKFNSGKLSDAKYQEAKKEVEEKYMNNGHNVEGQKSVEDKKEREEEAARKEKEEMEAKVEAEKKQQEEMEARIESEKENVKKKPGRPAKK